MRESICFITSYSGANIDPENFFRDDGCYGSEYSMFETAKRLAVKYDVFITVRKQHNYFMRTHGGINWIAECDYNNWVTFVRPKHIVVMRFVEPFLKMKMPETSNIYFWLHDLLPLFYGVNTPNPKSFMSLINGKVTNYISVGSEVIKNHYVPKWGMDGNKFRVIKNGITLEKDWNPMSSERKPLSFVFSSSEGKGLWRLLDMWPRITEKYPSATLDIFYGYPDAVRAKLAECEKTLTNVRYRGKVSQYQLFEAYKNIDYWLFPCEDEETCSTTTFETAYYGPIQITNKRGALIENVSGIMCDDENFIDRALETIESLESNKFIKKSIRQRQYNFAVKNTWDSRVEQWISMLEGDFAGTVTPIKLI